jgi:hypothetical protein
MLAGAAAAIALPLLTLGLNLPLWLAALIAAALFGGLWMVLRPGGGPGMGQVSDEAVLEARSDTARGLLLEASRSVDQLKAAAKAIKDKPMGEEVRQLAAIGEKVLGEVRDDPNRAMAVRRLLTFYLPNAASLAEGWRTLEGRALPSPERVSQTREIMHGLTQAFGQFADQAVEPQLQTLDLDLKVLRGALKSDLEKTS